MAAQVISMLDHSAGLTRRFTKCQCAHIGVRLSSRQMQDRALQMPTPGKATVRCKSVAADILDLQGTPLPCLTCFPSHLLAGESHVLKPFAGPLLALLSPGLLLLLSFLPGREAQRLAFYLPLPVQRQTLHGQHIQIAGTPAALSVSPPQLLLDHSMPSLQTRRPALVCLLTFQVCSWPEHAVRTDLQACCCLLQCSCLFYLAPTWPSLRCGTSAGWMSVLQRALCCLY